MGPGANDRQRAFFRPGSGQGPGRPPHGSWSFDRRIHRCAEPAPSHGPRGVLSMLARTALAAALAIGSALGAASGAAAQEPDLIFRKSTVWHALTPDDKLAVYGIDDPD